MEEHERNMRKGPIPITPDNLAAAGHALLAAMVFGMIVGCGMGFCIGFLYFGIGSIFGAIVGLPAGAIAGLFGAALGGRPGWAIGGLLAGLCAGVALACFFNNGWHTEREGFLGAIALFGVPGMIAGAVGGWQIGRMLDQKATKDRSLITRLRRRLDASPLYGLPLPIRVTIAVVEGICVALALFSLGQLLHFLLRG